MSAVFLAGALAFVLVPALRLTHHRQQQKQQQQGLGGAEEAGQARGAGAAVASRISHAIEVRMHVCVC